METWSISRRLESAEVFSFGATLLVLTTLVEPSNSSLEDEAERIGPTPVSLVRTPEDDYDEYEVWNVEFDDVGHPYQNPDLFEMNPANPEERSHQAPVDLIRDRMRREYGMRLCLSNTPNPNGSLLL